MSCTSCAWWFTGGTCAGVPTMNGASYKASFLMLRPLAAASRASAAPDEMAYTNADPPASRIKARSEERRVGKECRTRWTPEHEKKKKQTRARDNRVTHERQTHSGENTREAHCNLP